MHWDHHRLGSVYTHDSGVVLLNKRKVWDPLAFYVYMNSRSKIYYYGVTVPNNIGVGDKETLPMAMRILKCVYRLSFSRLPAAFHSLVHPPHTPLSLYPNKHMHMHNRRPYYLVETTPGIAGLASRYHTMVQYWPGTTMPLLLHRNCWKWRPGSLMSPDKGRSWTVLAHALPNSTVISDKAVDTIFWKCSVSLPPRDDDHFRMRFESVFPFDVERVSYEFGMEIVNMVRRCLHFFL